MKVIKYIGLILFYGGIILMMVCRLKPEFLSQIDDFYIDILWPIGMIIYGTALYYEQQENKEASV